MIKLTNLTKKFGNTTAVSDLNIHVKKGSIFAFLGNNGAGKTTTIRMITGVIEPTYGKIEIGNYDISQNPIEAKMLMGVIADRPYLYNKLTGREFLHFMADIYKVPHRRAKEKSTELLQEFGLTEKQYDLIETYSHGMKQRLSMCASLIHDPQILVVDEPLVGLDPGGTKLLKETFIKKAKAGLTIFMSTHSLSVAQEIADHLAIIKKGAIIAQGTLQELQSTVAENINLGLEEIFLQITSDNNGLSQFTED